jgi:hypothetical protein
MTAMPSRDQLLSLDFVKGMDRFRTNLKNMARFYEGIDVRHHAEARE